MSFTARRVLALEQTACSIALISVTCDLYRRDFEELVDAWRRR